MAVNPPRVFAASTPRAIAIVALSLAGVAFGLIMSEAIPASAAGTAFLVIPILAAGSNVLSLWPG